ncbi:MAG: rhomboid family intramembrane serine protease [Gammaproteobacteria bacterium]|nr:rhomboid family intramembrane serine protease [Gammaproteobacteria bacterium]
MKYNLEHIKNRAVGTIGFLVAIWLIFVFDRFLPLENYGLIPRSGQGMYGIVSMPFLHSDWKHILNNTWPLLVLLNILANTTRNFWQVIASIVIGSGILLWIFGRTAIHIGASGLVFGLIGYLLVAGLRTKESVPLMGSAIVFSLYGGIIFSGISPLQSHVSWEGHLFGLLVGAGLGWLEQGSGRKS